MPVQLVELAHADEILKEMNKFFQAISALEASQRTARQVGLLVAQREAALKNFILTGEDQYRQVL